MLTESSLNAGVCVVRSTLELVSRVTGCPIEFIGMQS